MAMANIEAQTFHEPAKASAIAERNQRDDADWTYKTRIVGTYAVVDVYDEDGEYVGTL